MDERLGGCGMVESHAGLNGFLESPPRTARQLSNTSNGLSDKETPVQDEKLEPLAVVGFSLKFPQDAATSEGFWRLMTERRCAMTEWPKERLNVDAFYHPDNSRPDTISFKGGHFLREPLGNFDAPFFSITSAEAAAMDAQQRLLLETAYRALENAGIPMEKISGSKTSVFSGCFTDDYKTSMLKDLSVLPTYCSTGMAFSMLAARLSWFFDLRGPCANLDSACSSSMMAFDMACQGLRNGDSEIALVAGASLAISLEVSLPLSLMNFFSKDSKSFSFDHRANGYGRGEGFGVIVLKRLTDAIKDGDTIRAIVRSTGSNQDGRTPGITQPSAVAQELLIRETYEKAGLDLESTRYVEAHGTGTAIGDPTEASAIGNVFRGVRSVQEPIYVGAVKSNIGHLEGASGVASIIKTIMVLETGIIPPNANFERLNPRIDADFLKIKIPVKNTPWPTRGLRRASISSFGFGGSNSHAVLDDACNYFHLRALHGNHSTLVEPPTYEELEQSPLPYNYPPLQPSLDCSSRAKSTSSSSKLLIWSAADKGGVSRLADAYSSHLSRVSLTMDDNQAAEYLESLAYTLDMRRTSLTWKSFAVVDSIREMQTLNKLLSPPLRSRVSPRLGYVFTGQGAQYAQMLSKGLLSFSIIRDSLVRSEIYLRGFGCQWPLLEEFAKTKHVSKVNDPAYSQVLCTTLQIALIDLLRDLKVAPTAVVGHSSGEIAAAYCVGGISHKSACQIAYFRGIYAAKLALNTKYRGAMMAAGLSNHEAATYLEDLQHHFRSSDVYIACINSPKSVTLSGDERQIDFLKSLLDQQGIFARKLQVNVAYHSPQMKHIATDYLASLADLEPGNPTYATNSVMVSSINGRRMDINETRRSDYWIKNLVSPVQFSAALAQISSGVPHTQKSDIEIDGAIPPVTDLLEVGPHSALQGPCKDTLKSLGVDISYSSTLVRSHSGIATLLHAVGRLHCLGYKVDIFKINRLRDNQMVLVDLPEYPFDHSLSYWHDSRITKEGWRLRKHPRLDLLGSPVLDFNPLEAKWRNHLRVSELPWIKDHNVMGTLVYPAAGMIVMAIEAVNQLASSEKSIAAYSLRDVVIPSPLKVSLDAPIEAEIHVRPSRNSAGKSSSKFDFRVYSWANQNWTENCQGTIQLDYEEAENEVDEGKETAARLAHYSQTYLGARKDCNKAMSSHDVYEEMRQHGFVYGPTFRTLKEISCSNDGKAIAMIEAFKWIAEKETDYPQPHVIHPTTLDAFLQLNTVALSRSTTDDIPSMVPTRIGHLWISSSGIHYPKQTLVNAYAEAAFLGRRTATAQSFALEPETNQLLLYMDEAEITTVATRDATPQHQGDIKKLCYEMSEKPDIELLTPEQLVEFCEDSNSHEPPFGDYYATLDLLLLRLMHDATDALEQQSEPSQYHLQQYARWLKELVQDFHCGQLPHLSNESQLWASISNDTGYRETLHDQVSRTTQGKALLEVGRNIVQLLRGELDPTVFLSQNILTTDYTHQVPCQLINTGSLRRLLALMWHKSPPLKILEVGAGTGSFSDIILDALSLHNDSNTEAVRCSKYYITDPSSTSIDAAMTKYKKLAEGLEFQVLDLTIDPLRQGYEPESYDLIFCAHLAHSPSDLEVTLRNAHRLLRAGGKVILVGITQEVARANLVFGLLPGWWAGDDQLTSHGAYTSKEDWDHLLSQSGFSGVDHELRDYSDDSSHEYSVLVSTAVRMSQHPTSAILSNEAQRAAVMIVTSKDSRVEMEIAQKLRSKMTASKIVQNCSIVSLDQIHSIDNLESAYCLSLVEIETPFLAQITEGGFNQLRQLLTIVPMLLWITQGETNTADSPYFHLIDGLSRVLRTEISKHCFVTLALENSALGDEATIHNILKLFSHHISKLPDEEVDTEYIEKQGLLEIRRVIQNDYLNSELHSKTCSSQVKLQDFGSVPAVRLQVESPGLLDSLYFSEDPTANRPLAPGEVQIKVESVGVNFRDCLTVLGQIDTPSLGSECAGTISRVGEGCILQPGDRIAACLANTYGTYARGSETCAIKIPEGMSYTEASTVPVIFVTAWHALYNVARLQSGESVLIHSGAGGTGQAAIQVAKYLGAEIYTSVGSNEKKRLLMSTYGIPEDNIFYDRNMSFAQGIMRLTKKQGVDVILNSLSGANLTASWECLAPFGRFVEIGKQDINSRNSLPMAQFGKIATFSSVDLYPLFAQKPDVAHNTLKKVMTLFAEKKLHVPQPFRVFGVSEIEDALRLLQSGRAPGKMAIEMRASDRVRMILATKPECCFDSNASYIIAGGLGGLGRSTAKWMASRGAKNLILLSRSGARSDAAIEFVKELRAMEVHVDASPCDVTDAKSLDDALTRCAQTMPPVKGCIQATMHLRDALFEKMMFEDWKLSLGPKVQGTWNLHSSLPSGMDFFLCFSSISGIIGSAGTANYSAGNTFIDEFVRYRVRQGEKAASLDLGWMTSIGVVAESAYLSNSIATSGFLQPISPTEFHALLDHYCNTNLPIATPNTSQVVLGLETPVGMRKKGLPEPPWMKGKLFSHLQQADSSASQCDKTLNYGTLFRDADTLERKAQIVMDCLVEKLSKALSISIEDIDRSKPLHTYGVDSLLAVELRNYFAREMDVDLAVFDIMGGSDFATVSGTVARKSQVKGK